MMMGQRQRAMRTARTILVLLVVSVGSVGIGRARGTRAERGRRREERVLCPGSDGEDGPCGASVTAPEPLLNDANVAPTGPALGLPQENNDTVRPWILADDDLLARIRNATPPEPPLPPKPDPHAWSAERVRMVPPPAPEPDPDYEDECYAFRDCSSCISGRLRTICGWCEAEKYCLVADRGKSGGEVPLHTGVDLCGSSWIFSSSGNAKLCPPNSRVSESRSAVDMTLDHSPMRRGPGGIEDADCLGFQGTEGDCERAKAAGTMHRARREDVQGTDDSDDAKSAISRAVAENVLGDTKPAAPSLPAGALCPSEALTDEDEDDDDAEADSDVAKENPDMCAGMNPIIRSGDTIFLRSMGSPGADDRPTWLTCRSGGDKAGSKGKLRRMIRQFRKSKAVDVRRGLHLLSETFEAIAPPCYATSHCNGTLQDVGGSRAENADCVDQQFEIYAIGRLHGDPIRHDDTVYLRAKALKDGRDVGGERSWSWFGCSAHADVDSLTYDSTGDTMTLEVTVLKSFRTVVELKRRGGKQRRQRVPVAAAPILGGALGLFGGRAPGRSAAAAFTYADLEPFGTYEGTTSSDSFFVGRMSRDDAKEIKVLVTVPSKGSTRLTLDISGPFALKCSGETFAYDASSGKLTMPFVIDCVHEGEGQCRVGIECPILDEAVARNRFDDKKNSTTCGKHRRSDDRYDCGPWFQGAQVDKYYRFRETEGRARNLRAPLFDGLSLMPRTNWKRACTFRTAFKIRLPFYRSLRPSPIITTMRLDQRHELEPAIENQDELDGNTTNALAALGEFMGNVGKDLDDDGAKVEPFDPVPFDAIEVGTPVELHALATDLPVRCTDGSCRSGVAGTCEGVRMPSSEGLEPWSPKEAVASRLPSRCSSAAFRIFAADRFGDTRDRTGDRRDGGPLGVVEIAACETADEVVDDGARCARMDVLRGRKEEEERWIKYYLKGNARVSRIRFHFEFDQDHVDAAAVKDVANGEDMLKEYAELTISFVSGSRVKVVSLHDAIVQHASPYGMESRGAVYCFDPVVASEIRMSYGSETNLKSLKSIQVFGKVDRRRLSVGDSVLLHASPTHAPCEVPRSLGDITVHAAGRDLGEAVRAGDSVFFFSEMAGAWLSCAATESGASACAFDGVCTDNLEKGGLTFDEMRAKRGSCPSEEFVIFSEGRPSSKPVAIGESHRIWLQNQGPSGLWLGASSSDGGTAATFRLSNGLKTCYPSDRGGGGASSLGIRPSKARRDNPTCARHRLRFRASSFAQQRLSDGVYLLEWKAHRGPSNAWRCVGFPDEAKSDPKKRTGPRLFKGPCARVDGGMPTVSTRPKTAPEARSYSRESLAFRLQWLRADTYLLQAPRRANNRGDWMCLGFRSGEDASDRATRISYTWDMGGAEDETRKSSTDTSICGLEYDDGSPTHYLQRAMDDFVYGQKEVVWRLRRESAFEFTLESLDGSSDAPRWRRVGFALGPDRLTREQGETRRLLTLASFGTFRLVAVATTSTSSLSPDAVASAKGGSAPETPMGLRERRNVYERLIREKEDGCDRLDCKREKREQIETIHAGLVD